MRRFIAWTTLTAALMTTASDAGEVVEIRLRGRYFSEPATVQITVAIDVGVRLLQAAAHLPHVVDDGGGIETAPLLERLCQRRTGEQIHDHEHRARGVIDSGVDHLNDVIALESGCEPGLAQHVLGGLETGLASDELQCHASLGGNLFGLVHGSESAPGEGSHNRVTVSDHHPDLGGFAPFHAGQDSRNQKSRPERAGQKRAEPVSSAFPGESWSRNPGDARD